MPSCDPSSTGVAIGPKSKASRLVVSTGVSCLLQGRATWEADTVEPGIFSRLSGVLSRATGHHAVVALRQPDGNMAQLVDGALRSTAACQPAQFAGKLGRSMGSRGVYQQGTAAAVAAAVAAGSSPLLLRLNSIRQQLLADPRCHPLCDDQKGAHPFLNSYESLYPHAHGFKANGQFQTAVARNEEAMGLQRITVVLVASAQPRSWCLADTQRGSAAFLLPSLLSAEVFDRHGAGNFSLPPDGGFLLHGVTRRGERLDFPNLAIQFEVRQGCQSCLFQKNENCQWLQQNRQFGLLVELADWRKTGSCCTCERTAMRYSQSQPLTLGMAKPRPTRTHL